MASLLNKTVADLTVAELLQLLQSHAASVVPSTSAATSVVKPKKEVSAGVAAWNELVTETWEEMKAEAWSHPETGKPASRKDAMAEASKRKTEADPEAAAAAVARRAKRDEQLAKKEASPARASAPAAPAAPVAPAAEKPKKVLSPEHLAKLKAGREAKKAAKDAEKAAAEAEAKGESPIALSPPAPAEAPVKAPKKPKEAKKAAPVAEVAAPALAPDAEEAREGELLPFKLGGATYIRMGISKPDGNHEWLSGDLWLSKKGARGSYAGELMEDGSINADAEEPTLS